MLDISTSLDEFINLSDVPTSVAIARSSTCERVSITIDHIPESGPVSIPIRIIEGMGEIVNRPTVSPRQADLISKLYELMNSSPVLKSNVVVMS